MACVTWCSFPGDIPDKDPESAVVEWEIDLSTFSDWFTNQTLGIFSGEMPVIPSQLYISVHTELSSRLAPGAELTDKGYARFVTQFERVSDIKRWNPVLVSSPTATDVWTVLSLAIWDNPVIGAGNYYAFGNLSEPFLLPAGSRLAILENDLIIGCGSP